MDNVRTLRNDRMDLETEGYPKQFTYEDLQLLTDDFDVRNFIGRTQFCKVYRGKIPQGWNEMHEQDVTVKIWADTLNMKGEEERPAVKDNVFRFYDEIRFLSYPGITGHPNLAKLMGCYYYDQNNFGVVYDLKSLGTVRNFIAEGAFKWMDRIKVIFQLARLLQFLHGQPTQYLVQNISAAHIMVDQDLNPVLFEFGMLTGGKIGKRNEGLFLYPWGAYGYTDQLIKLTGLNWKDTLQILRGIANALLYLHSTDFVIGDLKPPNILLDENHEPKLCDFGTAGRTGFILNASTPGYMDPSEEYTGLLETSYDIYSFGVMLLHIVMKKNDVLGPNMKHIKDLAREAVDAQKHVVSVKLKASGCRSKDRRSLTKLGVQMTELCPLSRPTINEVFSILESMKVKKVKSTFYEASQKLKRTMKI